MAAYYRRAPLIARSPLTRDIRLKEACSIL